MIENLPITQNLSQAMSGMSLKQRDLVVDMLRKVTEEYKKNKLEADDLSLAFNYQRHLQELIEENLKDLKGIVLTCKKGCSFCCKMNVDISDEEAKYIVEFSKENNINIDKEKLKKQSVLGMTDWRNIKANDRRCVFLNDRDECSIYEARPYACRKYYVASDPHLCDIEEGDKLVQRFVMLDAEILMSSIYNISNIDSMSRQLLKELK